MPSLRDRLAAALGSRYVVDRELASGGMGVVFLGHDPALGRELAIKVLPPERATAVAVERFVRESRLLARLAHPHIVPVLEAQQQGDLFWFIMPRVSGSTLAEHLASNGVMSEGQVRRLGAELLDALAHSHQQGVIHRDIKPANIFLHADHALLADFGVAALLDSTTPEGLTRPGESVGTPAYMAPEQIAGGAATELSDQHAIAATLYEAISGRRWQAVANEVGAQWQGVPTSLVPALRRALERDPARRWPSAAAFAKALGARRMRRGVRVLVGGAVALLLAATWWIGGTRLSGAIPSQGVADLTFEPFVGGSDSLGSEIPQAAAFELERFPRINVVRWNVRPRSGQPRVPAATRVVSGRILREGRGEVSLQVMVRDRDGNLTSTFGFDGQKGDVVGWGAAIADSLVHFEFLEQLDDFRMLVATRPSLKAMRRYFRGQDLFQRDQWELAGAEFRAARELDSTLVLATWHELIALKWQRLPFEERLAELAGRADRLPVPMDALIRLQMRSDLRARIAGLDSLVGRYPHYAVVRQIRDNELFHRGPLIGRPLREGLELWSASATEFALLDQADTYAHTVWGALRLGDASLARSQLGAHRRVAPEGDRWGSLLALALDSRDAPVRARVRRWMLGQLADSSSVAAMRRAVRLGLQLDDPDDQRAIGVIVASRGTNEERATGESAQATAELLQGHLAAARAALLRGRALVPSDTGLLLQSAEWPVALPMFGVAVAADDRSAARELLTALSTHSGWSARANWALAIDAQLRSDSLELNERLGALRAGAARDPVAASLLPFVEALQHAVAGRLREALAASEAIYLDPSMTAAITRGPFVRSAIYFNRGKWQLALGNRTGAEREWLWHENNDLRGWPAGEPQEGELDAALSAIARLYRGENLLDLGKGREGCALLRRVGELWTTPDSGFADLHRRWQRSEVRCHTR